MSAVLTLSADKAALTLPEQICDPSEGQRPARRKRSARRGVRPVSETVRWTVSGPNGRSPMAGAARRSAGPDAPLPRQTVRPAQANMSAVLPLSADKPRPPSGLFTLLSRQTIRPAQANMSAVLPLSADKRPPRRAVRASLPANRPPGPANMSAVLTLSADKRPPRRVVHASLPANHPPGPRQ